MRSDGFESFVRNPGDTESQAFEFGLEEYTLGNNLDASISFPQEFVMD